MSLSLYNTLSRRKESFEPIDPAHVRLYVCGPTVWDFAHIGNARPVVVFDVLARLLRRLYPRVTYVRNVTDVDDKIMDASRRTGEPIESLTARTLAHYHQDMAALGALPPDIEPRATQHIGQMIAMIEVLLKGGHAYAAEGHVLFSVPSMHDYGRLSGRNRDEQIAGARVDVAPYKQDPADFVLWKPSGRDQPGWDSPWGRGRPGWHIECSAMAATHLGQTFDIHGGGIDLVFPHHENEIAQSRCANGTPIMARVWMHNGYLVTGGEKMSKSLGNFVTVHELLKNWPGEAIRLALLSGHYRQPLEVSEESLRQSRTALDRLYGALRPVANLAAAASEEATDLVLAALQDDLSTPIAIAQLHDLAGRLNKAETVAEQAAVKGQLLALGETLGLLQADLEQWFKGATGDDAAIDDLIARRRQAREARDFAEADRLRRQLTELGVQLGGHAPGHDLAACRVMTRGVCAG